MTGYAARSPGTADSFIQAIALHLPRLEVLRLGYPSYENWVGNADALFWRDDVQQLPNIHLLTALKTLKIDVFLLLDRHTLRAPNTREPPNLENLYLSKIPTQRFWSLIRGVFEDTIDHFVDLTDEKFPDCQFSKLSIDMVLPRTPEEMPPLQMRGFQRFGQALIRMCSSRFEFWVTYPWDYVDGRGNRELKKLLCGPEPYEPWQNTYDFFYKVYPTETIDDQWSDLESDSGDKLDSDDESLEEYSSI